MIGSGRQRVPLAVRIGQPEEIKQGEITDHKVRCHPVALLHPSFLSGSFPFCSKDHHLFGISGFFRNQGFQIIVFLRTVIFLNGIFHIVGIRVMSDVV